MSVAPHSLIPNTLAPGNRLIPILEQRLKDVAAAQDATPLAALEAAIEKMPAPRGFIDAVTRPDLQVIAEIKRGSPSAGVIRAETDPAAIAQSYERGGAAALSILTEPHFFRGSLEDFRAARAAVRLPCIRKDFVVHPYQLAETRAIGADACLLIVAALGQETKRFLDIATGYGLDALVEVHDEAELRIAIDSGARLIGVNNRDLTTFKIDIATSERLAQLLPSDRFLVAESGLETSADFARMARAGAACVLVGTSLMTTPDPGARLADILASMREERAAEAQAAR